MIKDLAVQVDLIYLKELIQPLQHHQQKAK